MNDPIKYMLVGAAIAVGSATISGVVVGWSVSQTPSARPRSVQSSTFPASLPTGPAARLKLPAQTAASIFPPGQFTPPPTHQSGSSNIIIRPATKSFPPPAAFQKAQELPEVKAARDAFMQAQKRYSETMKKAMESGQGAVASASKSTPLTIQVPPAGAVSNGTAQVKVK
ncbi:MAG: hypothetical protein WA117_00095 [Verrucomicrobiia bacterium]